MPNAFVLVAGGAVLAALGYFVGMARATRSVRTLWGETVRCVERTAEEAARVRAFERAAQAAALWPHRITRRGDLARHLLSLATAPEMNADVSADDEEPEPTLPRRRPALPQSGDDVPADDEPTADETSVDVYREQGFL